MLGENLLKNSKKVSLDEAAYEQFNIVNKEIKTLAEKSGIGWDLVASELFDKTRGICFSEGVVCGALIAGVGIITGACITKLLSKPKQ